MKYKLPKLEISGPGQIWMKAIYSKMKKGEQVEYRHLRAELVGTLPLGFVPDKIDNRLLKGRVGLTLLGIWNIDPESDFIPKTDSVIKCIASLLTINPDLTRLDANLVAEQIDISIKEVRVIFHLITMFGEVVTGERRMYLHLFYNDQKATDDKLEFNDLLDTLEMKLLSKKRNPKHEKLYAKYYEIKEPPVRGITLIHKQEAIDAVKKNSGYFALLSKVASIA